MNFFSSDQTIETRKVGAKSILRQCKLDLISGFLESKSINAKITHKQRAQEIGCSHSTLKRYRKDKKMISLYKSSFTGSKRPQMNPKDSSSMIAPAKPIKCQLLKKCF